MICVVSCLMGGRVGSGGHLTMAHMFFSVSIPACEVHLTFYSLESTCWYVPSACSMSSSELIFIHHTGIRVLNSVLLTLVIFNMHTIASSCM